MDFTIYPDTWIRDLPLLHFGNGAYIANKATIGTNICLQSGEILVDRIHVGDRSVVGHLAIIGLGTRVGSDSELGVRATTGMNVTIGDRTRIGALCGLNHGCSVGSDSEIGAMSYVGLKSRIEDGLRLCASTQIPDGSLRSLSQLGDEVISRPSSRGSEAMSFSSGGFEISAGSSEELDRVALTKFIRAKLQCDPLLDDLNNVTGLDSLGRMQLINEVESQFGISIDPQLMFAAETIGDCVNAVLLSDARRIDGSNTQDEHMNRSRSNDPLNRSRLSECVWFAMGCGMSVLARLLFRLEVSGRENLPTSGAYILCPNQQSYLDPPLLLSSLPWSVFRRLVILGDSDFFSEGFGKRVLSTLRLLTVTSPEDMLPTITSATYRLRNGDPLLIYPEGGISRDGEVQVFKHGAAMLATNAKVPIIPVALDGFCAAWPVGKSFARFTKLRITFGKPINALESGGAEALESLSAKVRQSILNMLHKSANAAAECLDDSATAG